MFATDVNEALLDRARQGLYAKGHAEQISPERLRRFFVEEQGGYRVSKRLRQRVVFARQNLLSDPPFSRLDLISCRNVLIYIESDWQSTILPAFHYALRPGGFLLLGKSESIGPFTDLFEPVGKKPRIFARKAAATPLWRLPRPRPRSAEQPGLRPPERDEPPKGTPLAAHALREAQRLTINRFAPPSVLLDAGLRVLEFRGATGAYLEPPAGKASFELLKMARQGLDAAPACRPQAGEEGRQGDPQGRRAREDQCGTRCVDLEVIPLKNLKERCYLVFFEEVQAPGGPEAARKGRERVGQTGAAPEALPTPALARRLREAERELAETRDYLQSVQEQHEAANEELQASNEEITSANEELQSINEELETSKEELESGNEELMTLNDELARRNKELDHLNSDLNNLLVGRQHPHPRARPRPNHPTLYSAGREGL